MAVVLPPELHAFAHRRANGEDLAGVHRLKQLGGELDGADLLAFRFDPYRTARLEATQLVHEERVEPLLRGLCNARNVADERTAVAGQALEIEHLGADVC